MAAWLHGAAFLATALLAWRVARVHPSPSRGLFLLFVLAVAWWALCAWAAQLAPSPAWYLGWWRLAFLGIAAAPVAWLAFVDAYTHAAGPRRRRVAAAALVPALTVALALAAPRVPWLLTGVEAAPGGGAGFALLRGPWYWFVHLPYTYALLGLGALRAHAFARRSSPLVRRQVGILLVAIAVPVAGNLLGRTGALETGSLDLTVVGFTVATLVIAWALYVRRFLEVPPGAYRAAFERVDRGVLILDARGRLIDANRAAAELLGIDPVGRPVRLGRILPSVAAAMRSLPSEGGGFEVRAPSLPARRVAVDVAPLRADGGEPYGHVLLIRPAAPQPAERTTSRNAAP